MLLQNIKVDKKTWKIEPISTNTYNYTYKSQLFNFRNKNFNSVWNLPETDKIKKLIHNIQSNQ